MRDVLILFVHLIGTFIRLARPGGIRSVVAESVLVKHQLLILNRSRKRAPNLRTWDRIIAGLCLALMRPARVIRSAIVLRASTLLHFHNILVKGKYRLLFSPKQRRKRGPKGPSDRTHRRHRRDEARQSELGLPTNCTADHFGVRH
jgi:putative transposase